MTMSIAFFISPEGFLVRVPLNHISTVIAEPDRFGLIQKEIQTAYDQHREKLWTEGEARKEILLKIIEQGWIRIRRYPNRHWSLTAKDLSATTQERLRTWAEQMLSGINGFKEADIYMPVKISTFEGESVCTIGDLADSSVPGRQDSPHSLFKTSTVSLLQSS